MLTPITAPLPVPCDPADSAASATGHSGAFRHGAAETGSDPDSGQPIRRSAKPKSKSGSDPVSAADQPTIQADAFAPSPVEFCVRSHLWQPIFLPIPNRWPARSSQAMNAPKRLVSLTLGSSRLQRQPSCAMFKAATGQPPVHFMDKNGL